MGTRFSFDALSVLTLPYSLLISFLGLFPEFKLASILCALRTLPTYYKKLIKINKVN